MAKTKRKTALGGTKDERPSQVRSPKYEDKLFHELWDKSPTIKKIRQESFEKGFQEGFQQVCQERIQWYRDLLVDFVRVNYPDLVELAQRQASHFDDLDVSLPLIQQILVAPDVDLVRQLLEQKTI